MFVFKCPVHRVAKDAKNPKAEAALARLGTFLDNSSPQLVEWLYSLFQDQQKAVTYAELREAWLDGYESLIREWQEDYARFIADKLAPEIRKAAAAGGNAVLDGLGPNAFYIIDSDEAVKAWISTHTAELVTNISDSARKAINAIVLRGQMEGWTTDRMAYAIRPVIGLTKPQAQANANYFQHVLDTIREARPNIIDAEASRMASEAALKYAAQQHRYRANMIANTELAYAYNNGAHETTRKAIQEGLMGACVKIWSTAADSRVCPICQDLDGMQVGFDGYFGEKEKNHGRGFTMLPPAHPGCRCAVLYEEISPAKITLPQAEKEDIIRSRVSECKDFDEMKFYWASKYNIGVSDDIAKLHFEAVREAMQGVENIIEKFPKAGMHLHSFLADEKKGVMSASYYGAISFNPSFFDDIKHLQIMVMGPKKATHPKNTGIREAGSHEMAHIIERYLIAKNKGYSSDWGKCTYAKKLVSEACKEAKKTAEGKGKLNDQLISEICWYASYNKSECMAEAVADYEANTNAASLLSRIIWKLLEREAG